MTEVQVGDHAIVLGDTAEEKHQFPPGTEVEVLRSYERGRQLWECRNSDPAHSTDRTWWVHETDLKIIPSVTQEEIDAAIQSIKTREDMSGPRRHSPHFFNREPDGTVRLRIRFDSDEAALMEEAAGETPVMVWLHRTLTSEAKRQVREARRKRGKVDPPIESEVHE